MNRRRLHRRVRLLELWAASSALVVVALAAAAFARPAAPKNLGEITVERINVVDANGTLRLVIANKDRMHPGVMDGVPIDRPRPVAGMIFFNDEGDEVGGITYTGRVENGKRTADAGMMFDQLKQDQTIGFEYDEHDGQRTAGFEVWDRGDAPLSDLIRKLNEARKLADAAARDAAVKAARDASPRGMRRVFVGKETDRSATIALAAADGKPRLRLNVAADGAAAIEFLDANGNVVAKLPQR